MRTGLDRLLETPDLERLLAGRLGLLAHPASVTKDLVHVSVALRARGKRFEIAFGPEHGYGGEAQDMIGVTDARDAHGTPIRSLYGESYDDLSPKKDDLARIDMLVIDLADIGTRFYTFVWTAVLAMRACAKANVRVLVLDRPNPLGGMTLEGRCLHPSFRSFVGLEPLPIRHAMTLGEIALWRSRRESLENLTVIGADWDRQDLATAWDRPFVMPSPNMPAFETALVYPGGCLIEGTNLSEGRGTTRPFEIFGAPFLDAERLARDANALGLPGFVARPITFQPTFHKHAGKVCGGVQVHVTNPAIFRPVATYVGILALAHHQAPAEFRFRTERYEFVDTIPAFDLLTGSSDARTAILAGESPRDIAESVSNLVLGDDTAYRSVVHGG